MFSNLELFSLTKCPEKLEVVLLHDAKLERLCVTDAHEVMRVNHSLRMASKHTLNSLNEAMTEALVS